jgi:hypothetical protein
MNYYAGIDLSLEYSSVCALDGSGKIVREAKVLSEPDALIAWFGALGFGLDRIGLEAGPLSQWLYAQSAPLPTLRDSSASLATKTADRDRPYGPRAFKVDNRRPPI